MRHFTACGSSFAVAIALIMSSCGAVQKFRGKFDSKSKVSDSSDTQQNSDLDPINESNPDAVESVQPLPDGIAVDPAVGESKAAEAAVSKLAEEQAAAVKAAEEKAKEQLVNDKKSEAKKVNPAEFVFILDSSPSMWGEKLVSAEFAIATVVRQLVKTKPEAISKIFVISSAFIPLPIDKRIVVINRYVHGSNGLDQLLDLANGRFLDADKKVIATDIQLKKNVILISDGDANDGEDDDHLDAFEFSYYWQAKKLGPVSFNGIVGTSYKKHKGCKIDDIGSEYIRLSDDDSFKGETLDICQTDIVDSVQSIVDPLIKGMIP